jgi:hypothetical protein
MIAARNSRLHYTEAQIALSRRLYCDQAFASPRGFEFLIHMLSKGCAIFFGDGPEGAAQAFGLYGIESLYCNADRVEEYLTLFERHPELQHVFADVTVGGVAVPKSVYGRIRMRMASDVYLSYVAPGVGTIAAAPANSVEDVAGAVGWEAPGVTIEIIGEDGGVLPAGREGAVRVQAPWAEVCVDNQSAVSVRDGFCAGDAGFLTDDRLLVIRGLAGSGG